LVTHIIQLSEFTMSNPITAFIPYSGQQFTKATIEQLQDSGFVEKIFLLTTGAEGLSINGCESLPIDFGQFAIERFLSVAETTVSGLVYSDYYDIKLGVRTAHPVIDYQEGSVRDDFSFGSVMLLNSVILKEAADEISDFTSAGLYALRLAISRQSRITRVGEFLYSKIATCVSRGRSNSITLTRRIVKCRLKWSWRERNI
jgi:hypothetical protein